MRPCTFLFFALLTMTLAWAGGCRTSSQNAGDPFAAADQPPATGTAEAVQVVQAAHQQGDVADVGQADLPGVSLDETEKEPGRISAALSGLKPSNISKSAKEFVGLGADERLAKQLYTEGDQLFAQKQYEEAASKYKKAARRWPDSMLEEDALFMVAECQFLSDQYPKASDTYTNLLKKYDNSRHLDKIVVRRFAIAKYWEQVAQEKSGSLPNLTDRTRPLFGANGNAIANYEAIRLSDPTGPLADDATMAVATNYFLQNRFEDAAYHYDLIRNEHPQSEHQAKAHLMGLQSKLNAYEGPQYDAAPLEEAGELVEQTTSQFAAELPGEEQRLAQAREAVRAQRAERDWEAARYYERLGYHRAARYYWNNVVKTYPDTRFAEMSREKLEETKDLPPNPPNRFKWLTRLFGDDD